MLVAITIRVAATVRDSALQIHKLLNLLKKKKENNTTEMIKY